MKHMKHHEGHMKHHKDHASHHHAHKHPHSMHHGHEMMHSEHKHHKALYEHETDHPGIPPHGHQERGMGCMDFKGEAQDIAFGQAGPEGMRADEKRMSAQFKNYHWDSDTGGVSGY